MDRRTVLSFPVNRFWSLWGETAAGWRLRLCQLLLVLYLLKCLCCLCSNNDFPQRVLNSCIRKENSTDAWTFFYWNGLRQPIPTSSVLISASLRFFKNYFLTILISLGFILQHFQAFTVAFKSELKATTTKMYISSTSRISQKRQNIHVK